MIELPKSYRIQFLVLKIITLNSSYRLSKITRYSVCVCVCVFLLVESHPPSCLVLCVGRVEQGECVGVCEVVMAASNNSLHKRRTLHSYH